MLRAKANLLVLFASLAAIISTARAADAVKPIESLPANLGRPVDFEKDVYPIFESNCVACHNVGIAESKFNIESVATILKGGKRGAAVVPKNPAGSLMFQLASRSKHPSMPPLPNKVDAKALTPSELGILKQWILEGSAAGGGGRGDALKWQPIPQSVKSILSVAISPWGRFVAAGRVNQVVIYDLMLGQEVARLTDPALADVKIDGRPMYPGGAADRDFIQSLAFSPDESTVAAGGYRVVKLWTRPHDVQRSASMLSEQPTALATTADGSLIAVATADRAIQLVASSNGKTLRRLTGPADKITALQFSANGKTLYAASLDKSWRSWKVENGAPGPIVQATSPLTAILATKDCANVITAGADGSIRIWSALGSEAAKSVRELKGHQKAVSALALVLPDGKRLVSGGEDGTVRVWDIAGGKQIFSAANGGPVAAVAAQPGGTVIASAGTNKVIRLWQAADGKPVAEIKGTLVAQRQVVAKTESQAIAVQHVASAVARGKAGEQDVKDREEGIKKATEGKKAADKALADAKTKEKTATDALAVAEKSAQAKPKDAALKQKALDAKKPATDAALATKSASDALVSADRAKDAADKALAAARQRLKETKTQTASAEAAKVAADKDLAKAVSSAVASAFACKGLAFSADGKKFASAGDDGAVHLYESTEGRPLETFSGHSGAIAGVAFASGSTIVSAGSDKKLIAWDANPAWTLAGRIGPKSDDPLDLSASPFSGRVLALAFNADGTLLATGGGEPSRSGELKLWKLPSRDLARELKDAHSDTVFGVEFSRDGKYLASGAADKFVRVFDVAAGKLVRSFEGHTHHVLGVTWKADGSTLASAGADNQIKVWSFESGEQLRSIAGYAKQVTSIRFVGTGDDVVSSGGDKTVRLHRTSDGINRQTFEGGSDFMYSAAASRDESIVVGAGEDGVLRIWNGKNAKSLMTFEPPKQGSAQVSAVRP